MCIFELVQEFFLSRFPRCENLKNMAQKKKKRKPGMSQKQLIINNY